MEATCLFEVGQLVFFCTAAHDIHNRPKAFVVTAQIVERCSGGVQIQYRLSGVDGTISEIALQSVPPAFEALSGECIDEIVRQQVAVERAREAEADMRWQQRRDRLQQRADAEQRDAE